jgi:hypothetical protein
MRKKYMWWIISIAGVTLLAAALWGPIVSNVEQPKYQVVESSGNFEIRDYAPMIMAEVDMPGERRDAIGKGFRIIADYIFGDVAEAPQSCRKAERNPNQALRCNSLFRDGD